MTLKEQISVMQQFSAGKNIEVNFREGEGWKPDTIPVWDFYSADYRVEQDKYSILTDVVCNGEVEVTEIIFSAVDHKERNDIAKIFYDTHIRNVLETEMKAGSRFKFKLVPLNKYSERLVSIINKSEYAK